jgi:hypothetical protein
LTTFWSIRGKSGRTKATSRQSRRIEGEILGITATWGAFVESFMVKSFKIAEYFGVENRFRLSDTKSISYHK